MSSCLSELGRLHQELEIPWAHADEMLPAETPEGSLNRAFTATAASIAARHDLHFRKEPPMWTPDRHLLQDAVGTQGAVSKGLFLAVGGIPKQEHAPAQATMLEVSNASLRQLDTPLLLQSVTGHTLTAVPGANGALAIGGTGHPGITFLDPDGLQQLSCPGLPHLLYHTATLLSSQSSLPYLVAVLGGLLASNEQPNSAAFLLSVSSHQGQIQVACQELIQVCYSNRLSTN